MLDRLACNRSIMHCYTPKSGILTPIRNADFQEGPNAPQTVQGTLAIYNLMDIAAYWSATNCLSEFRTGYLTATVDGTAYPVESYSGTFAYNDDLITRIWTYTNPITLTSSSHEAFLVCL